MKYILHSHISAMANVEGTQAISKFYWINSENIHTPWANVWTVIIYQYSYTTQVFILYWNSEKQRL